MPTLQPLSRRDIETTLRIERETGAYYGRMEIAVPSYERTFNVEIWLSDVWLSGERRPVISDKTVETLNDVTMLSAAARECIKSLLHEDAIRARREVVFADPDPPAEPSSLGLRGGLFRPCKQFRSVALAHDDPRHPCYFENGLPDVEQKIKWTGIRITENDDVQDRFALLDCYPAWEDEHGVTVILRNGEPIALGPHDVDLSKYD